ncbi:hypothetical protein F8M41_020121 [Gigaspora margarita]|uniref:Uncharacterized protein n=1 Tax=Gigaspora margarita TaxID=4874 RepID=A0A8H4AIW4_GIGMA|nr:hypothetical protein F8M41_020121 [Gigaspora margarita]
MASKIFTGDMPELMENIFNNLNNEIYSLHSCALKVREWINLKLVEPILYSDASINIVINLLFKLFIESGATLNKLFVNNFFECFKFNSEIFCSLEQNEQFLSRLQHLYLIDVLFCSESAITFLKTLAKYATKISTLGFDQFEYYGCDDELHLIHAFINLIKSQEQLKLFSLTCAEYITGFYGIISALESQKNTLQEVILSNCCFTEDDVLKNCKNLETLRISFCDYDIPLGILNHKINTLEIVNYPLNANKIELILKKYSLLLQRLKLDAIGILEEESLVIKALNSFCPNITYLNITMIRFSTQLLALIDNLRKLQFLSLCCFVEDISEEELKIRVMQFAEILPLILQYLDLSNNPWLEPYIDILLNHCNAPLKKLLIGHFNNEKNVKALIKFCKRNKTLNYLCVKDFNLDDDIRNEVRTYVKLVQYEHIVINC